MKLRAKIKELEEVSDDELYGVDMEFLKELGCDFSDKDRDIFGWCDEEGTLLMFSRRVLSKDEVGEIRVAAGYKKYVGSVHLFEK